MAFSLQILLQGIVRPLVSLALIDIVVGLKVLAEFVEGVVGEVGKQVLLGGEIVRVRNCGKPSQSIFIDIDPKGVPAGDTNVDSHIELQPPSQQGTVNVLAHHNALLLLLQDLLVRTGQPNALALRTVMRLDDVPMLLLLLGGIFSEHADLAREDEGLGEEVVLSGEAMLHFG